MKQIDGQLREHEEIVDIESLREGKYTNLLRYVIMYL